MQHKHDQPSAPKSSWWEVASDRDDPRIWPADDGQTTSKMMQEVLEGLSGKWGCPLATAWSLDPVRGTLLLSAVAGETGVPMGTLFLTCREHLSGVTVERKRVTRFQSLAESVNGRTFAHPHVAEALGLDSMVSVPVLNTFNTNQVLMVINLFPGADSKLRGQLPPFMERELEQAAGRVAVRLETHLMEASRVFSTRLGIELAKLSTTRRSRDRACRIVVKLVREATQCDTAAIYLENADGKEISLVARATQRGTSSRRTAIGDAPTPQTGPAPRVWRTNREFLSIDLAKERDYQPDAVAGLVEEPGAGRMTALYLPLRDLAGKARGVIACMNRCNDSSEGIRPFSYEHVAVVASMGEAFVPQLEMLLADERRLESLKRMTHELRVPVVALTAAVELFEKYCQEKQYEFKYRHFDEMKIYLDLMKRQVTELEFVRHQNQKTSPKFRPTSLLALIVQPAKRFVEPLLTKHKLLAGQINHTGLDDWRKLHVDPTLMTQVVFNLLDNAIKYYDGPPEQFNISIVAKVLPDAFEILLRDNGPGVPEGYEELIFEFGYRTPSAYQRDVAGEGIGLWLAREIVQRHGGTLALRRRSNPTEFILRLPRKLEYGPPESPTDMDEEAS